MNTWWTERPGLLVEELAALEARGVVYELDETAKEQGILRLTFDWEVKGELISLLAIYPDFYPYVRPEVYARDLTLERHQNPAQGNLCLLGRATENWDVDRTLADHIAEQLPALLAAARRPLGTPSPVPEIEQGEPLTDYFPTKPGAVILLDSAAHVPGELRRGTMRLRLDIRGGGKTAVEGRPDLDGPVVRGALSDVRDAAGGVVARMPPELVGAIENGVEIEGRWVRMDPPPRPPTSNDDLGTMLAEVLERYPDLRDTSGAPTVDGRHKLDVTGILLSEEVTQGTFSDGWLFMVRTFRQRADTGVMYLIRAGRSGPNDLGSRIPGLEGLRNKTVTIIGLGGIGAPIALELARSQIGHLRLIDHDVVDAGTAVRWPFGLAAAGQLKVKVLSDWVRANEPYTKVDSAAWRIGGVRVNDKEPSDVNLMDEWLTGADLVIDATAEYGLHYVIATEAERRGINYLEVATRNGAWGGHIARVRSPICWLCYQVKVENLRLQSPPIAPAADPAPLHQPVGCADPTFTGPGFDVSAFGLMATRLAVSTLLGGVGYPDVPWDLAIIDLRTPDGIPRWQTFPLEVDPTCRGNH